MTPELPAGAGQTAIATALLRAVESARPDRLFDDPLAAAFVEEAGWSVPDARALPEDGVWAAMPTWLAVRTRFLDDQLLDATASGCSQVVLLAAGLDTRAFRLDWPTSTRLFELDMVDVLNFKEGVLAANQASPRCQRRLVPTDLRGDWLTDLADAGWESGLPTAWLAEGLLVYLSESDNEQLMREIRTASAAGSRLSLTAVSPGWVEHAQASGEGGEIATMWRSGLPEDPVRWLAGHGWGAESVPYADCAAAYSRHVASSQSVGWLIRAKLPSSSA